MNYQVHANGYLQKTTILHGIGTNPRKILLVMKLAFLFIIVFTLHANADVFAQQIDLRVNNQPLDAVFKQIREQSAYSFVFKASYLQHALPVTANIQGKEITEVLPIIFEGQPFDYEIKGKVITLLPKQQTATQQQHTVRGKVTDSVGNPLQGVTVQIKETDKKTMTDRNGLYEIIANPNETLHFRLLSYLPFDTPATRPKINVVLRFAFSYLDETLVIGYGTTTQRKNTGNVSKIGSETIEKQPVTNPLQSLSGRVAGLEIVQSNGLPGSPIKVRIRGQNSIAAGNNPLYVVDGVPFISDPIESLGGPHGDGTSSGSPMNAINPADIASIEILKDADATAIYGSRGSNGVILITTKKAGIEETQLDLNFRSGISRASRFARVLNTDEYLQVRKDALTNAGLTPTSSNAPDLVVWDANKDSNWPQWYMGGTAHTTDMAANIRGGNKLTTFLFGGGYHNSTTVLQGNTRYERGSIRLNLNHQSTDQRFRFTSSIFYLTDLNLLSGSSPSNAFSVSGFIPNYPTYDDMNNLNWTANLDNPIATLQSYYKSISNNLNGNAVISYSIIPGLTIKTSLGYNRINNNEVRPSPAISQNPAFNPVGRGAFGDRLAQTYIIEPQISYENSKGKQEINLLAGSTIQNTQNNSKYLLATGYTSDLLVESLNYGTITFKNASTSAYRYLSLFGRANYQYSNKYILNVNIRRDGSSKFGPGNRFGNFWSTGAAWIFSDENFATASLPWLSYGKLRASYGIAGNDAIGDHAYLNLYTNTTMYGSENAIIPSQIPNSHFRWEINKKLEFAMDIGLNQDRILLKSAWYKNRTGNQLVGYSLPSTAGFPSYQANFPAVVQNTGLEFELYTTNIDKAQFSWTTSINFSLPKNRLLEFPDIESSTYANTYIIGHALSVVQKYRYLGTDPETGLSMIDDINGDGVFTAQSSYNNRPGDFVLAGHTSPKWFGGIDNSLSYKGFQLDLFFHYVSQQGYNVNREYRGFGRMFNNYFTSQLNYWKAPGDQDVLPKPFSNSNVSSSRFADSDATISDASFLRLKSLSIGYTIPQRLTSRLKCRSLQVYFQCQNLFTITNFQGYDPESAWIPTSTTATQVPTLRTIVVGLHAAL